MVILGHRMAFVELLRSAEQTNVNDRDMMDRNWVTAANLVTIKFSQLGLPDECQAKSAT